MDERASIGRRLLMGAVAGLTMAGAARADDASQLVPALQHGGYVILMRHASSPPAPPPPAQAESGNTRDERQLDAAGRAAASAMGHALKALRIPVGEVLSSPTYRALETARLAGLAHPQTFPELGDGGHSMQALPRSQADWLRARAARRPRAGTDTFIVTQYPNIVGAYGAQAKGLSDGGALVLRPNGKSAQVIGRIGMQDWPRVAGASRP